MRLLRASTPAEAPGRALGPPGGGARRRPARLRRRLLAALLLAGVLPVMIAGYRTWRDQERTLRAEALKHAQQAAKMLAAVVGQFADAVRDDMREIAEAPDLRAAVLRRDWTAARRALETHGSLHPRLRGAVLVDAGGIARAATGAGRALLGMDLSERPNIARARHQRSPVITDPFHSPTDWRSVILSAFPILDGDRIAGILAAGVSLEVLIEEIQRVKIGDTGFASLQTAQGWIIADRDPSQILKLAPLETLAPLLLQRGPTGAQEITRPDGTRDFTGFDTVPGLQWVVVARIPAAEALASLTALQKNTWTLLGWLLAMVGIFALIYGGLLARPMADLADAARAVGSGELGKRVAVRRDDEVGEVARAFNEMADRRQQAEAALQTSVERRDTLTRLSGDIAAGKAWAEIVGEVVAATAHLLGAPYAILWRVDPERERLVTAAEYVDPALGPIPPQEPIPVARSLATAIVREGRPVAVPDVRHDPRWGNPTWEGLGRLGAYVGVPLAKDAVLVGALVAMDRPGRVFAGEEIEVLRSLGAHAALVIEKARLLEEARRAAEESQTLVEVGKLLTETVDLETVLARVVEKAADLLHAPACGVVLIEEGKGGEGKTLRFVEARGLPPAYRQAHTLRLGESVPGKAIQELRAVWSADIAADPDVWLSPETRHRVLDHGIPRAILAAPLVRGEAAIGGLVVYRPAGAAYSPAEVQFLTALASQAAVAIENARLYAETRRDLVELESLYEAGRTVTENLELNATLGRIAENARRLGEADRAFVWLAQHGDGSLKAGIALGPGAESFLGTRLPADSGAAASRAAREGRIIAVEDAAVSPEHDRSLSVRFGSAAMLAIPLQIRATVLGVLVCAYNRPRAFAAKFVEQLSSLARHAAIALENARLYAEAERRRREAEDALARVKQLQGLLPICSYCKKIRNDQNYWQRVETYVAEHTEARFSHGICPECYEKFARPELERVMHGEKEPGSG